MYSICIYVYIYIYIYTYIYIYITYIYKSVGKSSYHHKNHICERLDLGLFEQISYNTLIHISIYVYTSVIKIFYLQQQVF